MVLCDADFAGEGCEVERLIDAGAEDLDGAADGVVGFDGVAEAGTGVSGVGAEEADGGPVEDGCFGEEAWWAGVEDGF